MLSARCAWRSMAPSGVVLRAITSTQASTRCEPGLLRSSADQLILVRDWQSRSAHQQHCSRHHTGVCAFKLRHQSHRLNSSWLQVFEARPLAMSIAGKVGLDQLLYAPISTAIFFAWANIASGTVGNTRADLAEKFAPSVKAAWALWVPAMTINMALVPPAMRILFINATAIVWTMVLSSMADSGAAPDTEPVPLTDALGLAMASESVSLLEQPQEELETAGGDGLVSAVWQKLIRGDSGPAPQRKPVDVKPLAYRFEWPSLASVQSVRSCSPIVTLIASCHSACSAGSSIVSCEFGRFCGRLPLMLAVCVQEQVPNRASRSISAFGSMRNASLLEDELTGGVPDTLTGEDGECGPYVGSCELYTSQNIVDVLEECLP